jgi:hypothetical protein
MSRLTALERLMAAMDLCALTRAEAMWTNGYRAGRLGGGKADEEEGRLYAKEQVQFAVNARTEKAFRRLAQRLLHTPAPASVPTPRTPRATQEKCND